MIKVLINTENAAFEDDRDNEVGRIVNEAALLVKGKRFDGQAMKLFDINGNSVGELTGQDFILAASSNHVVLEFDTDNAAFEDHGLEVESARILRDAAGRIYSGERDFSLRDVNGNKVGQVVTTEKLEQEKFGSDYDSLKKDADEKCRFLVKLVLETGKSVDFFDFADDQKHAEELAVSAQKEPVSKIVSVEASSVFKELKAAGLVMDSHESDLYVEVTPESTVILAHYSLNKKNASTFLSNIDRKHWYDIPFAFEREVVPSELNQVSFDAAVSIAENNKGEGRYSVSLKNNKYVGKILGVTDLHVVQSLGFASIIFEKKDLDRIPKENDLVTIEIKEGKGVVTDFKSPGKVVGR